MARRPAILLYKGDWKRDPQLSMCSPATRGIWIDLICDMDDLGCATITGTARTISRTCRASEDEVVEAFAELSNSKTADISCENGIYRVTCRRVEKELHISQVRSEAVSNRYKPSTNLSTNPPTKEPTNNLQTLEDENDNANEDVLTLLPLVPIEVKVDAENIYQAYPRKIGKPDALKSISKAFDRLVDGEDQYKFVPDEANQFLLMAAAAFARSPDGQNGKYTPHPATWFNASRYLDNPQEWNHSHTGGTNGNAKQDQIATVSQNIFESREARRMAADPNGGGGPAQARLPSPQ